jgi:RNA polymerase-binding transcription factor DksA
VEERYATELAHSARVLDDVDRALERLRDGAYATCETCGDEIHDDDLVADPIGRTCARHRVAGTGGPPEPAV